MCPVGSEDLLTRRSRRYDVSLLCTSGAIFHKSVYHAFVQMQREIFQGTQRHRLLSPALLGNVHFPLPSAKNQTLTFKSLWPARKLTILPPPRDSPPAAPDRSLPSLNAAFIPPSDGAVLLCGNTLNDWIICFQTTGCAIRRLTGTLGALQFALHTWQLQRSP